MAVDDRPTLLDLFCCAGGASMGYHRAGFRVTGVDIDPQPNYPFDFVQADAMTFPIDGFDVVHASPPCQRFTQMSAKHRGKGGVTDDHVDLLTPTIERLREGASLYVVENVVGARDQMASTVMLHGGMFGLRVYRPRLFESNVLVMVPRVASRGFDHVGVYGRKPDGRWTYRTVDGRANVRAASSLQEASEAMDIDWMTWRELCEAIPPAYTEHIGQHLLAVLS